MHIRINASPPGSGTVFANLDDGDHWVSIWQAEDDYVLFEGDREEVLEWALSRPATAWWVQLFADVRQVQVLPETGRRQTVAGLTAQDPKRPRP